MSHQPLKFRVSFDHFWSFNTPDSSQFMTKEGTPGYYQKIALKIRDK